MMYEGLIQPVLAEVSLDSFAELREKKRNLEQSGTVYTSETRYSKKIGPSPVSPVSPVLSSFYTIVTGRGLGSPLPSKKPIFKD